MVELNSLNLQLENLKLLQEDAMIKGFSLSTITMLTSQIKEVEMAIEKRKILLEKRDGFNEP
jgi:hypothetical protein